jgi:electron transport complex protein RnfD
MFDVIIALLPVAGVGIYYFGYRAMVLLLVAIVSSLLFEWSWCKLAKAPSTTRDLSAVVSSIILVMMLPVTAPLWIPIVGSFFMIVVVKMCFGGLGQNFMNPAAAARVFLAVSFPAIMTHWVAPSTSLALFSNPNVLTSATPLEMFRHGGIFEPSTMSLYLGNVSGAIGETSAIAVIVGLIYLLWRKVFKLETIFMYLATVAVLVFLLGESPIYHLLSGGIIFGAVFLATDYTTSPMTSKGRMIYGIGLGLFTVMIRFYGDYYAESVVLSIILMNVLVPFIDKFKSRRYGT